MSLRDREVGSARKQIPSCIVGRALLIGSQNLRSWENSEWIAESLLDQTRFNTCVRECVSAFRARYNPACHKKLTSAGEMPEPIKRR